MDKKEYLAFMQNEDNIQKCEGCPENKGCDSFQNRFPCGQWNCWVALHCKENEVE